MQLSELVGGVKDALTVERVFGAPIERGGVVLLPVAAVRGASGGGEGDQPHGERAGRGLGAGFGLTARPMGAYVIKDGKVSFRPAFDLNRLALGGQIVLALAMLALRSWARAKAPAPRALPRGAWGLLGKR